MNAKMRTETLALGMMCACAQEILTKAHSNESAKEMARLESLLTTEEAKLFAAGRKSVDALNRWRFGGRTLVSKASLKRRLDSGQ